MIIQLSSKANSGELNALASNFNSIVVKSGTPDTRLTLLNTSLKKSNDQLTIALNKKSGSDKTELIWEFETLRDNSLKAFFLTVHGATFRQNKEIAGEASKIYEVIKRHGRTMYNLPHLEQTSKMDSLFRELASPAMVAALITTQTAVIVEETKKANQDFLSSLDERTQETATREDIALVTDVRKTVKTGMEKILNYLDSVTATGENTGLETIYTELTGIVAEANSNIKARITRQENAEKEAKNK